MTTLATLETNLASAQTAYNAALRELQAGRAKADRAVRRHARALQDQIAGEQNPTGPDVSAAQTEMQAALDELAALENKYGL
jgi:hypothetical protein